VTDITDRAGVEGLLEKVISKFGAVDGIINNAGIIQPFIKVIDLSYKTRSAYCRHIQHGRVFTGPRSNYLRRIEGSCKIADRRTSF
jgi:NAD(P)-dependent dehydrogenase (short-subunit alcohol dehydrogenase family)